ncbi:hypothetical protein SERLADRAFT_480402 [Serpula lacrymans var. lacrymans S7.9]|uniref:Major facilitator superfamily (MFS) profile domain-containing protein n=1 Tax=Serpula lacrymans var. lacrymans (strain S7.9) TaxID=578457 RepID=F8PDA1_SERL9|nr:uncharacterized protein SERLADRAFT_480402 [Serpula lacrymans var. lacrymans S7.9]EGO18722.1 hypothetical protein SERLADRAFT_480402 [Serpula lacrymans var. lacrymans S7.9]
MVPDQEKLSSDTSIQVAQPPAPKFVEGGVRGYLTIFGAFLSLFAAFGQSIAFGSFQLWYAVNQLSSYSASDISWIGSLQLWVFFFSGSFVGRLFDAYGPTVLLASGTVILTLSLMMTSLASRYYEFILAQGILFGIGFGLMFYPSMSATATHFRKYRATAMGVAVAGSSAGGVVFPILLQRLFDEVGFGWAVRISAFVCLACGIVSTLTVSSRLPKRKPGPWIDVVSLQDANFMLFTLGSGICCLGIFIPFFYIVQYGQDNGLSQALSFDLLSVMNAGSVIGRILPALMADYIGRYNLLVPFTAISGIFCLALWMHAHSLAALMCYAVFFGFFSGAFFALQSACIAQISQIEKIGIRMGMAYSLVSFLALVGGPIGGAILNRQKGNFSGMIVFTGVTLIVGSLVTLMVKLKINRNILAKV